MPKTASLDPISIARRGMVTDLTHALLDEFKHSSGLPWAAMPEAQQRELIDRVNARCLEAAKQAVDIIASANHQIVRLEVEQFAMKGKLKAILIGAAIPEIVDFLSNHVGREVHLASIDTSEMFDAQDKPKPDPDQPKLIDEEDA